MKLWVKVIILYEFGHNDLIYFVGQSQIRFGAFFGLFVRISIKQVNKISFLLLS